MINRFHACVALMFCSSLALAQEAATSPESITAPSLSPGNSPAPSSLTPFSTLETPAPAPLLTGSAPAAPVTTGTASETQNAGETNEESGFSLPGGYGYTPLNFTPGQGLFDRKPISFSTTLQQGYDDNIYGSSGNALDPEPVKGSFYTTLTEGVDILLAQSRTGFSMQLNGGGQYYYDRNGDQLTPTGSVNLIYAYKLTPRAQFSAIINGAYTTQPSLSVINGLVESNGKGYFTVNSKFDLLYQWTPRVSTDTTYTLVDTTYADSTQSSSDCLVQTIGQSVRYLYSPKVTGVVEVRASQTTYDSGFSDSQTLYFLAGPDLTLSRRLAASIRAGATYTDYDSEFLSSQTAPYLEASLRYTISRLDLISFNGRYGTNTGSASSQSDTKSTRLGLQYDHLFSPKLRGSLSVNYSHQDGGSDDSVYAYLYRNSSGKQDALTGTVGAEYDFTEKFSVFANYNHYEVFNTEDPLSENSRNLYYLGATIRY